MVVSRSDEARTRGCIRRNRMLRSLDLGVLPRDDSGPLSELQVCGCLPNCMIPSE